MSTHHFGEALRLWLAGALMGEDKRERAHDQVYKAARVSKGTFYAILRGEGEAVQQTKITALAMVLGKPIPMIDRVLRLPGDPLYQQPPKPPDDDDAIGAVHRRTKGGGPGGASGRRKKAS